MNKYERNAVEVSLDHFIDNMYDIRSYFEKPISFETIVGLGEWTLKLIKEHLEGDIEGLKETIEDNWDDKEEKESFEELLEWTNGALQEINKAIAEIKNKKKKPSKESFERAIDHINMTFKVFEYSDLKYNNRDEYADSFNDLVLSVINHIENKNN